MSLLVRKIDYNKWKQRNILEGQPASADAITSCMRTKGNRLSLWSIHDDAELEDAVLAMAAQFDHLDAIDVLSIDLRLIQEKGLQLEPSPGLTPYTAFKPRHTDVVELDYRLLGLMAEVVIESIRRERMKRFLKTDLIAIITNGVEVGKVIWSELKCCVRKRIPNPTPTEHAL